ncbi:MAG: hypothetical protein K2N73_08200, partial [Lachnospiraceae bacterium]|nr:hypothetical protein [Lachnospiraceae bacterium]
IYIAFYFIHYTNHSMVTYAKFLTDDFLIDSSVKIFYNKYEIEKHTIQKCMTKKCMTKKKLHRQLLSFFI